MNQLLQLRKTFESQKGKARFVPSALPPKAIVTSKHISELIAELKNAESYWMQHKELEKVFVSVYYIKALAKSNRIRNLLDDNQRKNSKSVVGAKFSEEGHHIITHYIDRNLLAVAQKKLKKCKDILDTDFEGVINQDGFAILADKEHDWQQERSLKKQAFLDLILDCYYVSALGIESFNEKAPESSLVTVYNTGIPVVDLMKRFGVKDFFQDNCIDNLTINLTRQQLNVLKNKAPYLIAMSVNDLSKIPEMETAEDKAAAPSIPEPSNEPTIGVIDTLFDEKAYFSKWVTNHDLLKGTGIPIEAKDYFHGTSVSSIIVDGPTLNPRLDDGCGRFKVRHFGVSTASQFNAFTVIRDIKEIVANNPDIKVWNLSLGSDQEINLNFISPEAAILDKIQYEYDVIFVIAGTNIPKNRHKIMRIGAPADSLNGIVVNSVDKNGTSASYTRRGPVLSFFNKPDVSYYGGVPEKKICVFNGWKCIKTCGTSYAAPWIARKLAYLMHVVGISKEVAKALLIDSAAQWEKEDSASKAKKGYGVVPIKIKDILHGPNDEIRFIVRGHADMYITRNFALPIPEDNGKQPFFARATMCYFPACERNQGVDYTDTELNIQFGRLKADGSLYSVDDNKQDTEGEYTTEDVARKEFRKWDNVKHICEKPKTRGKKVLGSGFWGIKVTQKELLNNNAGKGLAFGIVITLKEMNGVNRQQEFIDKCLFAGWFVDTIDVQNRIEIYDEADGEIQFDEN